MKTSSCHVTSKAKNGKIEVDRRLFESGKVLSHLFSRASAFFMRSFVIDIINANVFITKDVFMLIH